MEKVPLCIALQQAVSEILTFYLTPSTPMEPESFDKPALQTLLGCSSRVHATSWTTAAADDHTASTLRVLLLTTFRAAL